MLNSSFVDFWLGGIIFIKLALIDPETCPWVWLQIVSGTYTNQTYWFASHIGLWKVMERVSVFFIEPVAMNTLIGFKSVPQVLQVWICVGKCCPKGHKWHWVNPSQLFSEWSKVFNKDSSFFCCLCFYFYFERNSLVLFYGASVLSTSREDRCILYPLSVVWYGAVGFYCGVAFLPSSDLLYF